MGILSNIFEEKKRIWMGPDIEEYEGYLKQLRLKNIYFQAFKVNQKKPKCNGNCASCMAEANAKEDEELGYKKLGRGCSDDLLEPGLGYDLYTIFVKKSEETKALDLLGLEPWVDEEN